MLLVPYKRFRIRTQLNPEQCYRSLASIVQPEKIVPIVAAANSGDARLIFKGQVKQNSFYLRFIDRTRFSSQGNTYFLAISGQFKASADGTDVLVRVTLDPLFVIWIGFLSLVLAAFGLYTTFAVLTNPHSSQTEKAFLGISGVVIFLHYTVLPYIWFTYQFAKSFHKPSEALNRIFESASYGPVGASRL